MSGLAERVGSTSRQGWANQNPLSRVLLSGDPKPLARNFGPQKANFRFLSGGNTNIKVTFQIFRAASKNIQQAS